MLCSTIQKFLIIFVVYHTVVFGQYERPSIGTGEYSDSYQNGNINSIYPNYTQVINRNNSSSSNRDTRNDGYLNTINNPNAPRIRNPSSSPSVTRFTHRTSYTTPKNSYTTKNYPSLLYHSSRSPPSVRNTYRTAFTTQAPSDHKTENYTLKPNKTLDDSILRSENSSSSNRDTRNDGYLNTINNRNAPRIRNPSSSSSVTRYPHTTSYTTPENSYTTKNYHSLLYQPSRSPPSVRNTHRTAFTTQAPPDQKTENYTLKPNKTLNESILRSEISSSSNRDTRNDGYLNTTNNPNAPRIRNPTSSPSVTRYANRISYTTQAPKNSYTTKNYPSLLYHPSRSPPSVRNTYMTAFTTQGPPDHKTENYTLKPNKTLDESILRSENSSSSNRDTRNDGYQNTINNPNAPRIRNPSSSPSVTRYPHRTSYTTPKNSYTTKNYPSLLYRPSRSPPSVRNTYRTAFTTQAPPDHKTEKYTFKSNQMNAPILRSTNSSSSIRDTHNGVYETIIYNPNSPRIRNPASSPSVTRYPTRTSYTTQIPENSYTTKNYPSLLYHPSLSSPSIRNPYRTAYASRGSPSYKSAKNTIKPQVGERILRSVECGSSIDTRISNGEIATLSEYPWMVLLVSETAVSRERFIGAGTLITNRYVLSAAHCVEEKHKVRFVRLGEHDLSTEDDCDGFGWCAPPYEDVSIEKIIIHPEFYLGTLQSDIALIRLNRTVEFNSHIAPICLPLDAYDISHIPTNLLVAGWGETETGSYSNLKRKANVELQPFEKCRDVFNLVISDQICAGGSNGINKCYGDSGGPLFAPVNTVYVQFGIVSGGSNKCGNELPGTYTNVSKYIRWIMNNIEY